MSNETIKTKKPRFEIVEETDGSKGIYDYSYGPLSIDEICGLLNELNENLKALENMI